MSQPLLTTKFHIPRVRSDVIPRPHLIRRLRDGFDRQMTLLSAPAGFGKTTLLSEWVASCGWPVAWLSVDKDDNDLARFLAYVIASLQMVDEHLGAGVLGAFQSARPPPLKELLTELVNQINAVSERFILVLDDVQHLSAEPVFDALTYVLDHPPVTMHLALATRTDPPLPVARLRGRGQLVELRQADLRFTTEEASEFLNGVMGLDLGPDDVAALASRTEGWIAGLQLAAVSLQGRRRRQGIEDVSGFLQNLTGSHRFILDFLVEEVLQQQSPAIQEFLLKTSILERLTGPLCDAVLAIGDEGAEDRFDRMGLPSAEAIPALPPPSSQRILHQLETGNLFVVPIDDARRWYRYHHLFAELLRQRLQQTRPDLVSILHRRASMWYAQRGQAAAAIEHAVSAEDFERAAHLIDQAAETTMMRSEVATFRRWVGALPDDVLRVRPRLCVYDAWALLLSGRPLEVAEARLQDAVKADPAGSASGEIAAHRALLAGYRGDTQLCTEFARQALDLLPQESSFLRSLVAGILGYSCLHSGDVVVARQALEEAARISQRIGNLMNEVLAVSHVADLSVLQGRLGEARVLYEQALELAADASGQPQPIAGIVLQGLGNLYLQWNDLQTAAQHFKEGMELIQRWGEVGTVQGHVGLARILQAQGDLEGACEAIQKARHIAAGFDVMDMDDMFVGAWQARLWVARGDLDAAVRWAEDHARIANVGLGTAGQARRDVSLLARAIRDTGLAWVFLAQHRPDDVLKVLEPLRQDIEAAGWAWFLIHILVLESRALQVKQDVDQALESLERALSLAEPGGLVRVFVDEGEPMIRLLRQAVSRGMAAEYARKVLAALADERMRTAAEPPSTESLSQRELEVLRLIAIGLSNREIAEELVIATSTVKTHINNVYRKLHVSDRKQAIARARNAKLL